MKNISTGFCITKVKFRHKCYWNQQLLLAGICSNFCINANEMQL
ncbi:hypothetical protein T01_13237 [Trichinella spiralis]|uniref:Uncharacterized protein n=1 Tax=Trichinella spiralis TaxID=6334 RepID=A0A0V0YUQ9_TRISP|nr:hypothetical protein T01_13237 [Trichinella spiralis]